MAYEGCEHENCNVIKCFEINTSYKESDESAFDKLTDDCLINIFQYLPIIDRIQSEAVSKRWQNLIQKSWISLKHLTFYKNTWTHSTTRNLKKALITIDDEIFKNLMRRFGRYLLSIDLSCEFSLIQHQLTPVSIQEICQSCSKLRALNLGKMFKIVPKCEGKSVEADDCECESGLSKIIETLQDWKLISSLKKFGLEVLHVKAKSLSSLISKMESLESLLMDFEIYYYIEDSYLSGLPFNTLREVIFEECNAIEEELLIDAIKNIVQLQTLVLMELGSYNVLHRLSPSQKKTLKNLALGVYYRTNKREQINRGIRVFQSFTNLERLNLYNNKYLVKDEFLRTLAKYCQQLTFLDISRNGQVTDDGLSHVVSLPKLQYLFINYLNNVKGETLRKMENLVFLNCNNCPNLEDDGLCAIVRQSRLRILDVGNCVKLTNRLLNAIVQETNSRDNKLNLIFIMNDTNFDLKQIQQIPELLRIADSYEFAYHAFNRMNSYFPKIGPFGAKAIDLMNASEELYWL